MPAPEKGAAADPKKPVVFSPAPRIPAPLRQARPNGGFTPIAGMILEDSGKGKKLKLRFRRKGKDAAVLSEAEALESVEVFDEDQIPAWFYKLVLAVCILAFFGAFLFWNSSSPIIGASWKLGFLIEMALAAIIGLIVWVRLARKQKYTERSVDFAKRRKERAVLAAKGAAMGTRASLTNAARGVRSGGSHFRQGFQSDKEPNFIVKAIRGVFRFFVRIIIGIIRLIVWLFRLVFRIYVWIVQLLWVLYRGIVEPVVLLAFRIVRWALKVVYRVARWSLKVVWSIFYWLVRRWPIKYVTRLLEEPVRNGVRPKVLVTNVVVSDALGAPVKPKVRQAAEPYVAVYRLHRETRTALKIMEKRQEREEQRDLWLTIPTPEEKKARTEEKKRRKADALAREEELKLQEKEAQRQAKLDEKDRRRAEKEERKSLSKEEVAARKAAEKEAKKAEKAAKKGEPVAAATEAGLEAPAEPEKLTRKEKKARKVQEKEEAKEAAARAKQEAKDAKKAEKQAAKEAKKEAKKKGGDEAGADALADPNA